jgi:hypothetical protein
VSWTAVGNVRKRLCIHAFFGAGRQLRKLMIICSRMAFIIFCHSHHSNHRLRQSLETASMELTFALKPVDLTQQ